METSWVALSIKNIRTRASREMTSRKTSKFCILMGWTLPSTGMWRGEVFAISDCLVLFVYVHACICVRHTVMPRVREKDQKVLPGISVTAPIRRSTPWAFIRKNFPFVPTIEMSTLFSFPSKNQLNAQGALLRKTPV